MNDRIKERHVRWYRFLRGLVRVPISRYMCYERPRVGRQDTPFLLLANHNTDLDPVLIGITFREQMYFVASEHVFRKGFWSKLLMNILAPISRMKGTTDAMAALEIIRRLRKGDNICLFAEGNRSYTGVTGPVFPATGKLVKTSGATLITFRFAGGYLATPRWGRFCRRGPITGQVAGVYPPEVLKKMSADEINQLIARDLFEDAFMRQETEHIPYPGKALAEWLETALYVCPKCGKIGTLSSRGDDFSCGNCGFLVRYTKEGFFAGEDVPFATVRDWDVWQTARMKEFAAALGDKEAFHDDGVTAEKIDENHRSRTVAEGRLSMSKTALTIGTLRFPLEGISGMGLFGKAKIALTSGAGEHYEIRFPPARCGRKYFMLYELLHQ